MFKSSGTVATVSYLASASYIAIYTMFVAIHACTCLIFTIYDFNVYNKQFISMHIPILQAAWMLL